MMEYGGGEEMDDRQQGQILQTVANRYNRSPNWCVLPFLNGSSLPTFLSQLGIGFPSQEIVGLQSPFSFDTLPSNFFSHPGLLLLLL